MKTAMGLHVLLFRVLLMLNGRVTAQEDVVGDENHVNEHQIYKEAAHFVKHCGSSEVVLCMKERLLHYVDSLPQEVNLGGGFWIRQNEMERSSRQTETSGKPRTREETLDKQLIDRVADYVRAHRLEFRMPQRALNGLEEDGVVEGRGKKKGNKGGGGMGMKGMMMLFYMKAAMMGAIALKFIGLVAFKALLIAKVALTIAMVIALKKLTGHQHHTSTYEVVATPHHHDDFSHYDRALKTDAAVGSGRSFL